MSKFIDEIVNDIRENPNNWHRLGDDGLTNHNGIDIKNCGNGSKFFWFWLTSIVSVIVYNKKTDEFIAFFDKYKIEEAVLHWHRTQPLERF